MNQARVELFNPDHEFIGVVEEFVQLTWRRSLWGAGSANLVLPQYSRWVQLARDGWVILPPDEDDLAYIVRQFLVSIQGSSVGDLDLTAPGIGSILGNPGRCVIPPTSSSHDEQNDVPAETAIKHYVSSHAGASAAAERQLPKFTVAADQGRGANVTVHARYQPVSDVISDIARSQGIGWDITYDRAEDQFVFDVVVGTNRTNSVYFDLAFESILELSWLRSQIELSTYAYVAGQGTGADRTIVERYVGAAEPTGFDRREVLIDARDLDNSDALAARGDARLEGDEDIIEVRVNPRGSFRYNEQFFLGDLVTIKERTFGIQTTARVVGVERSIRPASVIPETVVSLGNPWPDLEHKIKGDLRRNETGHP